MATRTPNRGYTRTDRDGLDPARINDTVGLPLDEIDTDVQTIADTIAAETADRTAGDTDLATLVAALRAERVGEIRMTARPVATRGWLLLGSPPPRRADYPALFDALTVQQSCTTTARSRTLAVLDSSVLRTGWKLEGAGIPAGTTIASVVDATTITLSLAATASARGVNVRFCPWGNGDGATTFDLPPADRVPVGASSTHALGSTWGADTHQHAGNVPNHTHAISSDGGHTHGIAADPGHAHSIGADGGHTHGIGNANRGTSSHPSLTGSGEGVAYTAHVHGLDAAGTHAHGGATGAAGGHSHGGATGSAGAHTHGGATSGPSATAFSTDAQSSAQPSVAVNFEIYTGA